LIKKAPEKDQNSNSRNREVASKKPWSSKRQERDGLFLSFDALCVSIVEILKESIANVKQFNDFGTSNGLFVAKARALEFEIIIIVTVLCASSNAAESETRFANRGTFSQIGDANHRTSGSRGAFVGNFSVVSYHYRF
jgi:hypothetical protein